MISIIIAKRREDSPKSYDMINEIKINYTDMKFNLYEKIKLNDKFYHVVDYFIDISNADFIRKYIVTEIKTVI